MVWARLKELREQRRGEPRSRPEAGATSNPTAARTAKAAPQESQLLQVLLAEPALVALAATQLRPEEIHHPGLRNLLEGLYALHAAGEPPTLDQLRPRLVNPALAAKALELQDIGRAIPERRACLQQLLVRFREQREWPVTQDLRNRLNAANDHAAALELLRQLQNRNVEGMETTPALQPDTSPVIGGRS
jgi:DNA primase